MKHDDPHTLDLFAPEDSALPLRDQLHAWQTQGLLRPLDIAWMQFVHTHHPSAPDCVLLASALLAHVESRGHSCLPLADLVAAPQRLLAWDSSTHPDITAQWRQLPAALDAWLQALQHCPLVRVVGRDADSGQPMVLTPHPSAPKLYLRRYWHYERTVAQHILQRCRATPDPSTPTATATNIDPPTIRHWLDRLPNYKVLSLGLVDGRNVWRTDLAAAQALAEDAHARFAERLWLAPSCSLLHCPVDLGREEQLDAELRSWLAFAVQKCAEVAVLTQAINQPEAAEVQAALAYSAKVQFSRAQSPRIHKPAVQARLAAITAADSQRRSPFGQRIELQRARLQLPALPTTTIGSFPQTAAIRLARQLFKAGTLAPADYTEAMHSEIRHAVQVQENLGLDVLVHGEAERNDMVEYFAEQLDGYAFTRFGWVQSYGSRCVKPAVIFGDLSRPQAMTVEWIRYAQGLTDKVMKGMLTGPVTMLMWSFAREDVSREVQARQLALAIRDEVNDLEAAGIKIVQIDEAAFREGLPLRRAQWPAYLHWASEAFRLCASGVRDETQIHTHMCYSEFNDVIESIAAMDADVITIETSRSDMELLEAFEAFAYPNDIGPGVYDIHSPRIPDVSEMVGLLRKAAQRIPVERLWVNPDCGLKTRGWPETEAALVHMVSAARQLRKEWA